LVGATVGEHQRDNMKTLGNIICSITVIIMFGVTLVKTIDYSEWNRLNKR